MLKWREIPAAAWLKQFLHNRFGKRLAIVGQVGGYSFLSLRRLPLGLPAPSIQGTYPARETPRSVSLASSLAVAVAFVPWHGHKGCVGDGTVGRGWRGACGHQTCAGMEASRKGIELVQGVQVT